jgi:hypothetical protein
MARSPMDPNISPRRSLQHRPVLLSNLFAALVLEVCVLLRSFGVPLTDAQADSINGVVGLVLMIGAGLYAEKRTTSLADPRNNLGQPLLPLRTPRMPPAPPSSANPIGGQSPE